MAGFKPMQKRNGPPQQSLWKDDNHGSRRKLFVYRALARLFILKLF